MNTKTRRPWQPHMSSGPLFNPFIPPTDRSIGLDHIPITDEEEEQEGGASAESAPEQKGDEGPAAPNK
jgi:hypothetical protein